MSISIYLSRPGVPEEIMSLVGSSEARESWLPILRSNNCVFLEHAFSAGLAINMDNRNDVISESLTLYDTLKKHGPYKEDIANALYRCDRLIHVLEHNIPGAGVEIYIG